MPTSLLASAAPSRLHAIFCNEHQELEQTFEMLIDAFRADPRSVGLVAWRSFEKRLLNHLHVEEDVLFPVFERDDPALVATLRREHDTIRSQLDELGLGVELHCVRVDLVAQFVASLRAHAAREDGELYRRIDSVLTPTERHELSSRIVATAPRADSASA